MADKKLERIGVLIGGPGLVLQILAGLMLDDTNEPSLLAGLVGCIGAIMLVIGLGFTARSKGYPAYYCVLGCGSIIGIIIMAILPDKLKRGTAGRRRRWPR